MVESTRVLKLDDIVVESRFREDMGDVDELASSIAEKGLLEPILISPQKKLLAGGRRYIALRMLGITDLQPEFYRVIGTETRLDELEIELVENIMRKDMEWPERAKLEEQIFEHKRAADPEWTQDNHSTMLGQSPGSSSRRLALAKYIEAVPELAEARTEKEAWKQFGKLQETLLVQKMESVSKEDHSQSFKWAEDHYIVGDALKLIEKVQNGVCNFAEVDPPYAISIDKRKNKNIDSGNQMREYNEIDSKEYPEFLAHIAAHTYRVMQDNTFTVWWFGMTWYPVVLKILRKAGFKVNDLPAMWYKPGVGQTSSPDTMLGSSYEPFFIARKGMPKLRKAGRSNVFNFNPVPASKKIHPTERPVELMSEILATFAYPNARCIVPFLGSGVTLQAIYHKDLVGFGYDLSQENKDRFVNRIKLDKLLGDVDAESDAGPEEA